MTLVWFLIILIILILVHELGHFLVAKKSGIRVDEFGLGFPPKLFSIKKGETEYSLNAIPFGGFVKIYGESPTEEEAKDPDPRSFIAKPRLIQAAVLVAGVGFNIILAWLLLSLGFMAGLPMSQSTELAEEYPAAESRVTLIGIQEDSPAEEAGLKVGDKLLFLHLNDEAFEITNIKQVQDIIASADSQALDLIYQRGEEIDHINITPEMNLVEGEDRLTIGVGLDEVGMVKLPWWRAIFEGGKLTLNLLVMIVMALGQIIVDLWQGGNMAEAVVGPVGIFNLVGDAQALGLVYLLTFTAMISLNLAIINLIPFPALDGGRLLFLGLEGLFRRPIPTVVTNYLNLIGFFLLIGLLLLITYNDIGRLLG